MDIVSAMGSAQLDLGREVNPSVYPVPEFCRKLAAGQHLITSSVIEGPKIFLVDNEQQLTRLAKKQMTQGAQGSRPPRRR